MCVAVQLQVGHTCASDSIVIRQRLHKDRVKESSRMFDHSVCEVQGDKHRPTSVVASSRFSRDRPGPCAAPFSRLTCVIAPAPGDAMGVGCGA